MDHFNILSIYENQEDIPYFLWPKCSVPGCLNRCCMRLNSSMCYPHSVGRDLGILAANIKKYKERRNG